MCSSDLAGVGGMGVGADYHGSREGILLQIDLMQDTGAGTPESHAELGGGRAQEAVDLFVLLGQVGEAVYVVGDGLDRVVPVLDVAQTVKPPPLPREEVGPRGDVVGAAVGHPPHRPGLPPRPAQP